MKKSFVICLLVSVFYTNVLFGQQKNRTTSAVIDIGSQRELFADDHLLDRIAGKAELRLHHPVPQGVAISHDEPWEGNSSVYHTVFKDGDIFRMYYRGSQISFKNGKIESPYRHICYAESHDGIHWRKPDLGLFEFNGSTRNNIVLSDKDYGEVLLEVGDNASFFKDENLNAPPDARYKAMVLSKEPKGLLAFKSPDGIHWSPMSSTPVITDGAFDSQNLAFWDSVRGEYRAYWRYFTEETTEKRFLGVRAIRTATSKDFIHWENQADLKYVDSPDEELYTNQIISYYRAPHIFLGFPARYIDRKWSPSMDALPERAHREMRSTITTRYGTAFTEVLFMASRDGKKFNRWNEAFMRPGIQRPGTWNYGHHYNAWGLLETKSSLEGAPNELSIYTTENYWTDESDLLRRYTLRLDGFVSLWAPMSGGELVTKALRFTGKRLFLNFSTSAAGTVRVEIQDVKGNPLPGFSLDECDPVFGDEIERIVSWKGTSDVSSISGKPVRIRFEVKDGDVYSFHFLE